LFGTNIDLTNVTATAATVTATAVTVAAAVIAGILHINPQDTEEGETMLMKLR
jgi:hypothetical protein